MIDMLYLVEEQVVSPFPDSFLDVIVEVRGVLDAVVIHILEVDGDLVLFICIDLILHSVEYDGFPARLGPTMTLTMSIS